MRVCIYGRGKGREIVDRCLRTDAHVIAYIDNYSNDKIDYSGVPIIKHGEIFAYEYDCIIISLFDWKSIYEELLESGEQEDKIVRFFCAKDVDNYKYWDILDLYKWRIELLWRFYRETAIITDGNIHYELYADTYKSNGEAPVILDAQAAVERIVNEKKSLARFGDGEFEVIAGRKRPIFQTPDKSLSKRLNMVLKSNDERLLIAIADNYGKLDKYTDEAAIEIRRYLTPEVRAEHMKLLNLDRIYYDAYISRPYILYRNKSNASKRFENIRRIWNNRKLLVVEGEHTRNGVGNDLLSNAESVIRVIVPDKDAYSKYDAILKETLKYASDRLVLLSIGPTATVLAYDLVISRVQAIDIGQIDNEYEWYLMRTTKRCHIPGKTVSELQLNDSLNGSIDDQEMQKYFTEIVARIK